jgi:hypothetical protein
MATRNLIMVVDRKHSSKYPEGFAIHPDLVNKHSYVNMYMHHDGYPEWQGVQIANWLLAKNNGCQDGSRLASKLVHDMYYDSCYLYSDADNIDHEYRYIIWSGADFTNNETRYSQPDKEEIAKYNKVKASAQKIIDILTNEDYD